MISFDILYCFDQQWGRIEVVSLTCDVIERLLKMSIYKYVEEDSIDETLICSICASPFVEPLFHVDCGNTFCKQCLQNLQNCPLCRNKLSTVIPPPKVLQSQLEKLKVIVGKK